MLLKLSINPEFCTLDGSFQGVKVQGPRILSTRWELFKRNPCRMLEGTLPTQATLEPSKNDFNCNWEGGWYCKQKKNDLVRLVKSGDPQKHRMLAFLLILWVLDRFIYC